ncbi:MAG: Com family DNA-binding transcriptional regulator [Minisyncoccales bacterium]
MKEPSLKEYRCENCNKLLFKGDIRDAIIEIKCKRCKIKTVIKEEVAGIALIKAFFTSEKAKIQAA